MDLYYIIRNFPLNYYPARANIHENTGEIEVTCLVDEIEMIRQALIRNNILIKFEETFSEVGVVVKKNGKDVREYKPSIHLFNVGNEKLEDVAFALDSVSKTVRPHGNS